MIIAFLALLPAELSLIPARLQEQVDLGVMPGAAVLVMRKGKTLLDTAVGYADLTAKFPLRTDTIFRIASMTKPVTAAAIMMLADEGKLTLNDPVDRYLPEFATVQVAGNDGLRRSNSRMRIRHLLTHMSGINGSDPGPITDQAKSMMTLEEYAKTLSSTPLMFDPGASISYSGRGTSVAGRIVELVSGEKLESFLQRRLFYPLGMKDTHFFLPTEKKGRLAKLYVSERSGLVEDQEDRFRIGAKLANPAGGLYSTTGDMAKFFQLILSGGGKLLSRAAVDTMTQVQSFPLAVTTETSRYGFGFAVTAGPSNNPNFMRPGTFGHAGATGTYGWGDPSRELVGIYMSQCMGDESRPLDIFRTMVNASVPPSAKRE